MSFDNETSVRNLGVALGFFEPGEGSSITPSMAFFNDPVGHLRGVLANPAQRDALGEFLDEVVPGPPGDRAGWHPLLWDGEDAPELGNLYLILEEDGLLGIAGEFHTSTSPQFRLQAEIPLIQVPAVGDPSVLVGSAAHPIAIRAELDLPDGAAIDAIDLELDLAFQTGFRIRPIVRIRGFRHGGTTRDLEVDLSAPLDTFARQAVDVAIAALVTALDEAPEPLKTHLLPALGLDPAGPVLPIVDLANGPQVLGTWLTAQAADETVLKAWLGHVLALLGGRATAPAITGHGTWGAPLRGPIWASAGSPAISLDLSLAISEGRLYPGLAFSVGTGGALPIHGVAELVPVGIPLGAATVDIFPVARIAARIDPALDVHLPAPGGGTGPRVHLASAQAGLDFSGGQLKPVLELVDVDLDDQHFDRVDLSNLDAIAGLTQAAVETMLKELVADTPVGTALLGLLGLIPVDGLRLDLGRFVTDPLGEVLRWHRRVAEAGKWGEILERFAVALGQTASVTTTGTEADPWAFDLAPPAGPLHVQAVAWKTGSLQLHVGVRVHLEEGPFAADLVSALLELQIPDVGDPEVAVFRTHTFSLAIAPPPSLPGPAFGVAATRIRGGVSWTIGNAPVVVAGIEDVVFTIDGTALPALDLTWPAPTLSTSDVNALVTSLGLTSTAQLDAAIRTLVRRTAERFGGTAGPILGSLAGLGGGALPADFPGITSGFLEGPEAIARPFVRSVLTGASSTGVPFARPWLEGVAGLFSTHVHGAGVASAPWRIPLVPTGELELRTWLGPDAAPAAVNALLTGITDGYTLGSAASALRGAIPGIGSVLGELDGVRLGNGVVQIDAAFASGDGLIPLESAAPTIAGWDAPVIVTAAHEALVSHPDVVALVAGLSGQLVLVGAPHLDEHAVDALIPGVAQRVSFRVDGVTPDRVDLSGVSASAAVTVVTLAPGNRASLGAQIRRVLDRLDGPVNLVGHSLAGRAAVDVAQDVPAKVHLVVPIGAPLRGAAPPWLDSVESGFVVGLAGILASGIPAGPIADALGFARRATHGDALTGGSSFDLAALLDLVPVPSGPRVRPVGGRVGAGVAPALKAALQAATPTLTVPDRVGVGLSWWMGSVAELHAPAIRTEIALDLGEIGLASDGLDLSRPILTVRVVLDRGVDWLVGGPGTRSDGTAWPVRVRAAEVSARWDGATLTTTGILRDAAVDGAPANLDLAHPSAAAVLDAIFGAIQGTTDGDALITALRSLGLVLADSPRLAADAFAALRAEGITWLRPRLQAALQAPLYGHDPVNGFAVPAIGASLRFDTTGAHLRLDHALLQADATLALPSLALSGSFGVRVNGIEATWSSGTATIGIPRWIAPLQVWPTPSGATLRTWAATEVPSLLLSVAGDAIMGGVSPLAVSLPPIGPLLLGRSVQSLLVGGLNAAGLAWSLRNVSDALGNPGHEGLYLPIVGGAEPVGLLLDAKSEGDLTRLTFGTEGTLAGVFGAALELGISPTFQVHPGGTLHLHLPARLGGNLALVFEASETGLLLRLEIGSGAGAKTIHLFPTFGGWQEVLAGGVALLPHVLDQVDQALPAGDGKTVFHSIATAFGVYSPDFASNSARFEEIAAGNLMGSATDRRAGIVTALVQLFGTTGLAPLPGGLTSPATATLRWTPTVERFHADLTLTWTADVPALTVEVGVELPVDSGGQRILTVVVGAEGSFAMVGTTPDIDVAAFVALGDALGMRAKPRLEAGIQTDAGVVQPALRFRPLARASTPDAFELVLLPTPQVLPAALLSGDAAAIADLAVAIALEVLLPLVQRIIAIARRTSGNTLWPGGPTVDQLVNATGLFQDGRLKTTLPPFEDIVAGLLSVVRVQPTFGELQLTIGSLDPVPGDDVGVALQGLIRIPIETIELDLLFGKAETTDMVGVVLLSKVGEHWSFRPRLNADHLGLAVGGAEGRPLVQTDTVRLGSVDAFTYFAVDFADPAESAFYGVGAGVRGFGITIGGGGGSNGVAKNMLSSAKDGDGAPPQPGFSADIAWFLEDHAGHEDGLEITLGEDHGTKTDLGIRANFGPVYIDAITLQLSASRNPTWFSVGITGGVSISGFAAEVDNLRVIIPLPDPGQLSGWGVDLDGLAIAYSGSGVTVAGGLVRREVEGGIEYDGMLVVSMQTFGLVAVGAWARLQDPDHPGEEYDSFFVFAAASFTIAFPPYFTLKGIGAGFGFNRALVVPPDINDVPSFSLVAAMNAGSALAEHPMEVLKQFGTQFPARRGSLWFAAGMKGALFTIVDVVLVVYVALDQNVEIGVLGLGQLIQPAGAPIVSIELAIKIRYSQAEQLLSMQAQLTDNSWLLVPDIQLTGGFALFIWFKTGQFVLTIGGYHPAFQPAPEFPTVPRLGFRANLGGALTFKGEAYFALTNSCIMAGFRLEAAYDVGWLKAWFEAWADFLLSWDPFFYLIDMGIRLGADFHIRIDTLFGTIDIGFSVSIGAQLTVHGPPLGGVVRADLGPISITVPFGEDKPKVDKIDWVTFRTRYVDGGNSSSRPITTQVLTGMSAATGGDKSPDGSAEHPWVVAAEWSLSTRTAFPAHRAQVAGGTVGTAHDELGIVPMFEAQVQADHTVEFKDEDGATAAFTPGSLTATTRAGQFPTSLYGDYRAKVGAEARNLSALEGVDLVAKGVAAGTATGEINWAELVDEGDPKPLPFTRHDGRWRDDIILVGVDAVGAAARFSGVSAAELLAPGFPGHQGVGYRNVAMSATGRANVAQRRRPPKLTTLREGLTLEAPSIGRFGIQKEAPLPAVARARVELSAAQRLAAPARAVATVATTVSKAATLPRTAPPKPKAETGARLAVLGRGVPETRAAWRASHVGDAMRHRAAKIEATREATGTGLPLGPGVIHAWNLDGRARTLHLSGDLVRVVALGRPEEPLFDLELHAGKARALALPAGTTKVIVLSLGAGPLSIGEGFGAASLRAASQPPVIVGWSRGALAWAAHPGLLLGRGCRIRPSQRGPDEGLVAPLALVSRGLVETALPAGLGAVVVAAAPGELPLRIHVDGAEYGDPIEIGGEDGRGLLVPVNGGAHRVSVLAPEGGLVGVLGLARSLDAAVVALHGRSLESLVGGLVLGGAGGVTVRFEGGER